MYDGTVTTWINFIFFIFCLCQPLLLSFLPFLYFFSLILYYFTSHSLAHISLSFKLDTRVGLDSEWSRRGGVGVVLTWQRLKWSRRGKDRHGPDVAEIEVVIAWRDRRGHGEF